MTEKLCYDAVGRYKQYVTVCGGKQIFNLLATRKQIIRATNGI